MLRGLSFVLVLMYKFSLSKLAGDGVEGFTGSQAWCQQNKSPTAASTPDLSGHAGVYQMTPLPAQHSTKNPVFLRLEVLRLKTMLVCVTKQGQPHSYCTALGAQEWGTELFSQSVLQTDWAFTCSVKQLRHLHLRENGALQLLPLDQRVSDESFPQYYAEGRKGFSNASFRSVWWLSLLLDSLTDMDLSIPIA